jgi:inward rectifier potassium channel
MRQGNRSQTSLFVVKKKGNKFVELGKVFFHWSDLYHFLLTISWLQFLALISTTYLIINIFFAFAYLAQEGAIANARPGSFVDAFSFSVQTMATIGYGAMYPQSLYAHLLVSFEVLLGLLGVAMATSLMFARFSTPTARILFSKLAVICSYNGVPTLMFRIANQRNNWIVEAQLQVSLLLPEELTQEGFPMRRLYYLPLSRERTPFLALTWVVMHPITENSPLYNLNEQLLRDGEYQFFVSLTGLDATLSQTIHARHIYHAEDIIYNHRFVDVVKTTSNGNRYIDYKHFHDVISLG